MNKNKKNYLKYNILIKFLVSIVCFIVSLITVHFIFKYALDKNNKINNTQGQIIATSISTIILISVVIYVMIIFLDNKYKKELRRDIHTLNNKHK